MKKSQNHRLVIQIAAVVLMLVMVLGSFWSPTLLQKEASLEVLDYQVYEQYEKDEDVYLKGSFERDITEGESLWVYAENAMVEINVAGKSTSYNKRGNTPAMFQSPGSGWYEFTSPKITKGEEIGFRVKSYYQKKGMRAAKALSSQIYVGNGVGFLALILGEINLFSVALFLALMCGLLYMFEGSVNLLQGKYGEGLRIGTFGFYCLSGGFFCVTDLLYPYLSLLIAPRWVVNLIDVGGCLPFPIAISALVWSYMRKPKTHKVMGIVFTGSCGAAFICLMLQLLGRADIMEQLFFMNTVMGSCLSVAIACIFIELHCFRDNYLRLLLLTVLPVFVSVLIEGYNIWHPFMVRRIVIQYGFGLSILMLAFQIVSYVRAEIQQEKRFLAMKEELENSHIAILLSQIQPHFLYNTLQGIKHLCDTNPPRASEALEYFAFYLRGNLDSLVNEQLIPFSKELAHIKDYLYLEKMRFSQKLHIEWELEAEEFLLPPLTVQPLIENAIRHGIIRKKEGGTLLIHTFQTEEAFIVRIHDDGVGFDLTESRAEGHTHVGIANTRRRLQIICGGSLSIESEKGIGTTAKVIIPKEAKKCELSL